MRLCTADKLFTNVMPKGMICGNTPFRATSWHGAIVVP